MADPASTSASARRPTRPPSQSSQPARADPSASSTIVVASGSAGSVNSHDMSDDESADLSQDDHGSPTESVKSSSAQPSGPGRSEGGTATKSESGSVSGAHDASGEASSMPLQKRRRVTRACDECRRKKIKCDGKQPCTHCSVYSYDCTYDKPSNRRRNPAPQYIEALEARLQRAETLLRKYVPDVDLSDPTLDPAVQQEFRNREQARARAMKAKAEEGGKPAADVEKKDAQIASMIKTIGQLDLNDGEWDFHGTSSSAVFLQRMKEHFQGLLGNDHRIPFLPRPARPAGMFGLDSPRIGSAAAAAPWEAPASSSIYNLPPRERTRRLCYYTLNCATCLLRVVHVPTFYEMVDKLYATPRESWGGTEHRFLGLLYSVLALGCVYNVSEDNPGTPPITHQAALEEGTKYYASARLILQDVAECRDMASLQGLIYMILFLQATSNISGCYAFLGIALRSCLRMGLHRYLPHEKINPIEDESRRRAFHVVRQMDTYVSAMLGFPILLQDEDIDQPMPTEVDDEFITKDGMLTPPPGTPSFFQAFNAHNRLMGVLAKVVKYIYPLNGVQESAKGPAADTPFMISYARIKDIEIDLQQWQEQLPIFWRPSSEGPIEVIRVRTLLRFGFAHVQMMLYRPFLHYISPRLTAGKQIDDRYYNCAAAGISVSRNIIHIGIEIQKQAVLIGPYWFILYTELFAILSLIFYVLENPDKPGSAEIMADANAGRDVIANLARRSLAADRITKALEPIFDQLAERLGKTTGRPAPNKKRPAPGPKSKGGAGASLPARPSLPESTPQRRSEDSRPAAGSARRAVRGPPPRTSSFDTVGMRPDILRAQTFGSMQDILPMDVSMAGPSSDASGGTHRGFQPGHASAAQAQASSLYKVDSLMFSSADPFAYPNQPLLDPASQAHGRGGPAVGSPAQPDAMQFYMPNLYEGIEGQLLGNMTPYLMQQSQGQDRIDPAIQMFNMGPEHGGHHAHPHHPQQMHPQQMHPQHHQQQQGEMMEDMLAEPTFQEDWDDMLGNPGYR